MAKDEIVIDEEIENPQPGHKRLAEKLKAGWQWAVAHKKITIPALAVVLLGISGLVVYQIFRHDSIARTDLDTAAVEEQVPTTKASPLTGLEVEIPLADRPVTALIIENSPDARPQSGLIDAGIVFEAVTEGGITRFLAFYQEARPAKIGPVRSLRSHYLDWAMGFDASFGHVGGSPQALEAAANRGAKSLNQFYNGKSYYRSSDRYAPHNVYTSMDKLDELNASKGYKASSFKSYTYKVDTPAAAPANTTITVDYSGPLYRAVFTYNPANNDYGRAHGGEIHLDQETGQQLAVKNVVIIRMPTSYSGQYAVMETIGSGAATVLRDGIAIEGTWRKNAPTDQLELLAADGTPIPLNAGKSWFAVVPTQGSATY